MESEMQRRNILKSVMSAMALAGLMGATTGARAEKTGDERARTPPRGSYVEARDGTELYWRSWGEGAPVLFVAAWGLPSDAWQYQMIRLADEGLRCVAFDRRGHGRSTDPGQGYDIDTLADDIASMIAALDLRDVTLVGHSLGCAEIVRYISRHGAAKVKRVVLVAPVTPFLTKTPDNPDGLDRTAAEAARIAFRHDFAGILDANARPFVMPDTPQATIAWIEAMMTRTSLKALVECNRAVNEVDFRKELPAIGVPVLIVQGDADMSAPLALTGRKTAALIPGSVLKVYEGAPHGLIFTHVDRLNGDLLSFAGKRAT
jgi:non-heme chloroperoxidase